jgi:hypothetical protein
MADKRIPVSPIHGLVNTLGDATHRAFIQLKNPAASGFLLYVYELKIGGSAAAERWRLRRTAAPLTLAGTTTTATLARRDETDATAIVATLKGCTAVATQPPFAESDSFWYDRITKDGDAGYQQTPIIIPLAFPIIVAQGSAIEMCSDAANSSAINIRMYACWDEIAV